MNLTSLVMYIVQMFRSQRTVRAVLLGYVGEQEIAQVEEDMTLLVTELAEAPLRLVIDHRRATHIEPAARQALTAFQTRFLDLWCPSESAAA